MENELPKGWVETTLGEIAIWGSGGTPKRSEKKYYGGKIPWVKTGDLNNGLILEASEFITELGLKNSSAKLFPKGSIGIAMYGATIGKTAIFGIEASTNQACAVAQVHNGVDNLFLHSYLKSQKQNFIDKGKGGAQPNISQTVIKKHPFPLPPLLEQKRIVAKLDTLFAHLEKLQAELDRIPQLLKDFRQSVLTQAVTGKLTEEESGKWALKKISDISIIVTKGASPKWQGISYVGDYNKESILFITSENVDRFEIIEEKFKYVERKFNDKQKRSILSFGDVLTNIVGGSIGRTTVWKLEYDANINQAVCLIRPKNNCCLSDYLAIFLNSTLGLAALFSNVVDVARANVSLGTIKKTSLLLPPLQEQTEIVRQVEHLFSIADRIEAQYEELKDKIDVLPQAILAKAFRGELVEQLPTDGDARELLKEIQALKASMKKTTRGKRK